MNDQASIGWDQLFCDRLAYGWGVCIFFLGLYKVDEQEMSTLVKGRTVNCFFFDLRLYGKNVWNTVTIYPPRSPAPLPSLVPITAPIHAMSQL